MRVIRRGGAEIQHLISDAIFAKAYWILGRETISVVDLVHYANENDIVPVESTLPKKQFAMLQFLSIELDWRQPSDEFKLYPINSALTRYGNYTKVTSIKYFISLATS